MTDAELRELEDELRTNYGDSYVSWWVEEKMERLIEEVRRLRRVLQAMTISGRGGHEFRRWADDALMGKTCLVCGRFFGEAGCCGREEGRPTAAGTRTAPKEPPPGSR